MRVTLRFGRTTEHSVREALIYGLAVMTFLAVMYLITSESVHSGMAGVIP